MNNKINPLFNTGAAIYDSFTFLHNPAELTVEKAHLIPGQKVLDIACGSGWATMKAARIVGTKGQVIGIDIADKLLDIARQKAASSGLDNINYYSGDVHNLDLNDESFDTVLCSSSLFLFDDIPQVLNECYRVLKTGRTMVFSTFGEAVFQPVTGMINDYLFRWENMISLRSPVSIMDTPGKCRDMFISAGFSNVEITEEILCHRFPNKDECWRQISGSLIVRPRLTSLADGDYKDLKEHILNELELIVTPQGISVEVPVILCIVKKL